MGKLSPLTGDTGSSPQSPSLFETSHCLLISGPTTGLPFFTPCEITGSVTFKLPQGPNEVQLGDLENYKASPRNLNEAWVHDTADRHISIM